MARAAQMPRTVESSETETPTTRLFQAASSMTELPASEAYHLVVKPASGKVVVAALLKEKTGAEEDEIVELIDAFGEAGYSEVMLMTGEGAEPPRYPGRRAA